MAGEWLREREKVEYMAQRGLTRKFEFDSEWEYDSMFENSGGRKSKLKSTRNLLIDGRNGI